MASSGATDEDDTILRDVMVAAVSKTTLRQIALKMQTTRELPLSEDPVKAIDVRAHRQTPHDTQPTDVLRHLIVERNLTADSRLVDDQGGGRTSCGTTMGRVTARTRKTFKGAHQMGSAVPTVLPPYAGRSLSTDADARQPASAGRVSQFTAP